MRATPSLWLPTEIWWKILLESVVDTALLSDAPSSLNESLTRHAVVSREWSAIVRQPLFLREAKALMRMKGMLSSDSVTSTNEGNDGRPSYRSPCSSVKLHVKFSSCLWCEAVLSVFPKVIYIFIFIHRKR